MVSRLSRNQRINRKPPVRPLCRKEDLNPPTRPQKIKVKLADGKAQARAIQHMMVTSFWHRTARRCPRNNF